MKRQSYYCANKKKHMVDKIQLQSFVTSAPDRVAPVCIIQGLNQLQTRSGRFGEEENVFSLLLTASEAGVTGGMAFWAAFLLNWERTSKLRSYLISIDLYDMVEKYSIPIYRLSFSCCLQRNGSTVMIQQQQKTHTHTHISVSVTQLENLG